MSERAGAFGDVPATPAGHFGLCFHAAAYRLLNHVRRLSEVAGGTLDDVLTRHPFLSRYGEAIRAHLPRGLSWDGALGWWDREIAAWEGAVEHHLPLLALAREGGLGLRERIGLFVVGLGEEDARFGSLLAELQEPPGRRRPCLELIGRVMADSDVDGTGEGAAIYRALGASGLVDVVDRDVPRAEWELRVPGALWEAMREGVATAGPGFAVQAASGAPTLDDLALPDDLRKRLAHVPALLASGLSRSVVVQAAPGSDRTVILAAMARLLGRGVIEAPVSHPDAERAWPILGPLCTLTRAMPVIVCDPAPGERFALAPLAGYAGPIGVALGPAGGLGGTVGADAITVTLPPPTPSDRRRHWARAFAGHEVPELDAISDRFRLPPAYLRQIAPGAVVRARLDGRSTVEAADVAGACRAFNRELLDTLATRLDAGSSREQLVVSSAVAGRLSELGRRCRYREALATRVGPGVARHGDRGVRALFTGASGTGKTLAARLLAVELGVDLYRVDLSAVVNKYIGETEKNLHRVLTAAEELDIVLLLDEGEGLLGHRTEVRSANDRWSNLETDYLLQRLEGYQGIVLVTTNAADHIDPAFQRRMDVVIPFVPPQAHERWRLLQLHLPPDHLVEADDLERIAVRCALTGAQIRNVAVHAALLALDERAPGIERRHLEAAIHAEYKKAGAISPLSDGNGPGPSARGVETFVRGLMEMT